MRIVLMGPPASGKGTQAKILSDLLEIPHISTGDMLRAAIAANTNIGQKVEGISQGNFAPDEIVIQLVKERLSSNEVKRGFILDGFPRNAAQTEILAELLEEMGVKIDHVLFIDVPRELLIERATLRRVDTHTGQIYHLLYNPPPDNAVLEHRPDDHEDKVNTRLNLYQSMTAKLIPHYYQAKGLLRHIDGTGAPEEVTKRIFTALKL